MSSISSSRTIRGGSLSFCSSDNSSFIFAISALSAANSADDIPPLEVENDPMISDNAGTQVPRFWIDGLFDPNMYADI
jgi:hypothetical protein